ncbi:MULTISPECIES: histidine phosphatase family protein [unclassified Pseudomonas]|uniref:lipopolysaccharide core heptose(II)-phosphate phosphatase PmrG n=1 Tax=unclassified Pseudomonas TaxID=196821 RepID=UPI0014736F74|nr:MULTISPECIES: histidine phosphatase family protein [unclassified Pseudomonas]
MTPSLGLTDVKGLTLRSAFARYRNVVVVLAASVLALALTVQLLAPASAPNLAQTRHFDRVQALTRSWAQGDVIALVRHVERCDRSIAPCLGPVDGVTVRATDTARQLGADFLKMGLQNVDIYSSPLTRTRQTAGLMFERPVQAQDWLFNCRGTLLSDALKHKVPGRNLVLVTHSECMDQLEQSLHVATDTAFGYGASLFIDVPSPDAQPTMLGYIETADWDRVLPMVVAGLHRGLETSNF